MKRIPKLVNDLVAFLVIGKKELYLAIFNDKKENSKIKKKIAVPIDIIKIKENSFDLELVLNEDDDVVSAFVSSPYFPTSDKYLLKNFDQTTSLKLLYEAQHNSGVFTSKFEACFTGDNLETVTFVSNTQRSYETVFNEMLRGYFAKSGKKTKKWIPGHRYDNESSTFYYLGEFLSRKKTDSYSSFFNTKSELTPVRLYINKLGDEKTIEEVFQNRQIGKDPMDIKVLWKEGIPSCVDSGQKLDIGGEVSLRSMYPSLLKSNSLEALSFLSPNDSLDFSDDVRDIIIDFISDKMRNCLLRYWDMSIDSKSDEPTKISFLVSQFITDISKNDNNIQSNTYYRDLFSSLKIDLDAEAQKSLTNWNEDDLSKTLDDLVENASYFRCRKNISSYTSYQEEFFPDRVTIKSLFGDNILTKTLIDLLNYARANNNSAVKQYKVVKLNSDYTIHCLVNINNLIDFVGDDLSEELEKCILEKKFVVLVVYFNKNTVLE